MLNSMEFKKSLMYISGFLLATGGPITLFSASDLMAGMKRSWFGGSAATTSASARQSASASLSPAYAADSSNSQPYPLLAVGAAADPTPSPSLTEVLDFNVTVDWVMRRWPRVSTGLPQVELQGYRVPLVTGTGPADLAGSLTYYFNARQQVQRIAFRGTTGDPSALVALLSGRFHFARRLANDPGVVLYEAVDANNRSAGSLRIRSARVVKASQPYTRFEIDLAVERPG